MNGRPWTQEDLRRLHALRAAGIRPEEIAVQLGRSEGVIHNRLSRDKTLRGMVHPKIPSRAVKWTPEIVAEWRALWASGLTHKTIAAKYGTHEGVVTQRLRMELAGELPGQHQYKPLHTTSAPASQ